MLNEFKIKDVIELFDIKETKQTLINQEEKGVLPKAQRKEAGKVSHRIWKTEQLPEIGEKYGFLRKNKTKRRISVFTQKGGVLKSSFSQNLARTLALHNIKTLVVGLDSQLSITTLLKQDDEKIQEISQIKNEIGLYHYLYEQSELEDVIKKTDIPSLQYVPETVELALLEKKLRTERRKEYYFKDHLNEMFEKYDVVIFDCSPNWNGLIEACLTATDILVTPIECGVGGFQVLDFNLQNVREFQEQMSVEFEEVFLVPTLLEKNKISTQILGSYLQNYSEIIVPTAIRRAVIGQETSILKKSVCEYDPTSPLAQDYKDVISFIWNKVLSNEKGN